MVSTLGAIWVLKISQKAHWITVEGVYALSLISNTAYTVLKDFEVEEPPQIDLKSVSERY